MINQDSGVIGVSHPLMKAALRGVQINKFSGRSEDFEEWEIGWNQFLRLMHGGQEVLPDQTVLMTLKGYLDEASAADLQARLNADDNLSYYAYMEGLRSRHMRDVRATHRQNWSMVKLQKVGREPTLQEWSRFQANYMAKRALVEDWSDAEDQKLVFTQVPSCFHQRILTETNRRRRDKAWVRVAVPDRLNCHEVLQELERALGTALPRYSMDRRHFVIQCESPEQQQQLLGYDRGHIDGYPLRIQKAEYSMSGEELLNYVRSLLLQDDELRLLRQSYGCSEQDLPKTPLVEPMGGVFMVAQEERPKSPGQGSAKGANSPAKAGEQSSRKSPEKKANRDPNMCWECERQNLAARHDYRKCPLWQKSRAARDAKYAQQQNRQSRPQQTGGGSNRAPSPKPTAAAQQ